MSVKMPKKARPRKPSTPNFEDSSPRRPKRDRLVRAVSMLLVFGLVATFLIGALAGSPAGAVERGLGAGVSQQQIGKVISADTDGDGIENNDDSDIDGDDVVNGVDPDIDGDGIANEKDADPVGTLGKSPDKQVLPKTSNGESGQFLGNSLDDPWVRGISVAAILGLGVVIWSARRKRR